MMAKKINTYLTVIFLNSAMLALSTTAQAGELRIIDAQGLIRAVKDIQDEATVTVRLSQAVTSDAALLSPINGLSGDLKGRPVKEDAIQFERVSAGSWKIVVKTPGISVRAVELR
jgi:hypothetical protein